MRFSEILSNLHALAKSGGVATTPIKMRPGEIPAQIKPPNEKWLQERFSMESDRVFLTGIYHLLMEYGENPSSDRMERLWAIMNHTPAGTKTHVGFRSPSQHAEENSPL